MHITNKDLFNLKKKKEKKIIALIDMFDFPQEKVH